MGVSVSLSLSLKGASLAFALNSRLKRGKTMRKCKSWRRGSLALGRVVWKISEREICPCLTRWEEKRWRGCVYPQSQQPAGKSTKGSIPIPSHPTEGYSHGGIGDLIISRLHALVYTWPRGSRNETTAVLHKKPPPPFSRPALVLLDNLGERRAL